MPKVRDLMRPELEWGTLVLLVAGVVALVLGQYAWLALTRRGPA